MRHRSEFSELKSRSGLSTKEIATLTGFSESTIYRWESGETTPRKAALHVLRETAARSLESGDQHKAFRFIDLFAGIGGLRRGFESIGGQCVFTCEWDKYAQQTYRLNYKCDHEIAGDIRKIHEKDVPEHELLLAGFPCQPFSIAGVSKKNALNRPHGFRCDSQGTLFFDVARLIAHHRPKVFVLENVKNLLNHDRGHTFSVIRATLENDLGYQVHFKVLDARAWVPQHRERVFIVGFRDHNTFSFNDMELPDPAHGPLLKTILHPEDGSEEPDPRFTASPDGRVLEKYVLTDHLWEYLQAYSEKHRAKGNGFGYSRVGPLDIARTLSARYYKDGSEILISRGRKNPRRLTPRECSRLMGFDKPGESDFIIKVSDTQAYKQFGNSVVVPVVEAIATQLSPWIAECIHPPQQQHRLPLFG